MAGQRTFWDRREHLKKETGCNAVYGQYVLPAIESFLELNGYELRAGVQEMHEFLADVGAGKISPGQAEDWIATNLAKKRRKRS